MFQGIIPQSKNKKQKNNLRKNEFISSYQQLSDLKHQALSLRKVRAEPQGRSLEAGIEAKAMEEHLLQA